MTIRPSRRRFLKQSLATGGVLAAASGTGLGFLTGAPALATAAAGRPLMPSGLQTGDVSADRAMIWSRADRAARLIVDWSTTESFAEARRVVGPAALASNDFCAKIDLVGLPQGQRIFYRAQFQNLDDVNVLSEPLIGRFNTPPAGFQDVSFVWSGDTAGQGWGINTEWGGMKIYEAMRRVQPDFFIHSGDTVYADGPIAAEAKMPNGQMWKNVVIEEKLKVAETLNEFRANYRYNLMDENLRRFNAEVPMLAQWDDHETVNNWYPTEVLASDDRYSVKSAALLAARANRAFMEYMPLRQHPRDPERVYRKISYGPLLDVFFLDMRTYRAANGANNQSERSAATEFLGHEQIRWLKQELFTSNAVWKVIASDMPIGLVVYDNFQTKDTFENGANGNGPVRGREFDIADVLSFIKTADIQNVVWLTADVHYTAAHFYDPNQAQFQEFKPFWEFVSGPLNAGTFGPNDLDNTFGPQVMYVKAPPAGQFNLPPSDGMQFFGQVRIDARSRIMTVDLKDLDGATLYTKELNPEAA